MLLDDLNTPAAIAELHQLAHNAQHADDAQTAAAWRGQLKSGAQLLGLLNHDVEEWFHGAGKQLPQDAQIEEKINQRLAARAARDFAAADAIRDELAALGILLEDTADGTTWRIK